MEINSLFGIPAHPLLVHAAVVLVPLAAIGTAVIAVWGRARRSLGWVVVGFAFAAFGAVGVAQKSGGALANHVVTTALTRAHVEMGDAVLPWAFGILLASGAVMVIDTWRTREQAKAVAAGDAPADDAGSPSGSGGSSTVTTRSVPSTWVAPEWVRPVTIALGALAIVFAVGASVQVYRVGHSGARAVWQSTDMNGPSTGGGEEGG
ncbi:MAG: hypothetical protein ACXVLK_10010 [Acidimicrobiales bacterium]